MGDKVRCFVAVNLPGGTREAVGAFVASLAGNVRGVKWVKAENLHFTLKFLGNVEEDRLPALGEALEGAIAGTGAFTVALRGAGVFPPRGRPRVVWVDAVAGGEGLAALQSRVEGALGPLGFPPEERPFTPHLTVGRVKDLRSPAPLFSALAAAGDRELGSFVAGEVCLMRSELFPEGPRYSILRKFRLAPGETGGKERTS